MGDAGKVKTKLAVKTYTTNAVAFVFVPTTETFCLNVLKDDVANGTFLPDQFPTQVYPSCKDADTADADTLFINNLFQELVELPKLYVFVVPGTKLDVNTPNAFILSDVLFPNDRFPEIATSPVKYALDAVILPIKFRLPAIGTFKGISVIALSEPLEICKDPTPLLRYNSPSVNVADDVPLLI